MLDGIVRPLLGNHTVVVQNLKTLTKLLNFTLYGGRECNELVKVGFHDTLSYIYLKCFSTRMFVAIVDSS